MGCYLLVPLVDCVLRRPRARCNCAASHLLCSYCSELATDRARLRANCAELLVLTAAMLAMQAWAGLPPTTSTGPASPSCAPPLKEAWGADAAPKSRKSWADMADDGDELTLDDIPAAWLAALHRVRDTLALLTACRLLLPAPASPQCVPDQDRRGRPHVLHVADGIQGDDVVLCIVAPAARPHLLSGFLALSWSYVHFTCLPVSSTWAETTDGSGAGPGRDKVRASSRPDVWAGGRRFVSRA